MEQRTVLVTMTTIIVIVVMIVGGIFVANNVDGQKMTIYTYDSFMADPGNYDWVKAFEIFAGVPEGTVKVVRFSDAGAVLSRAIAEKDSPVADLLIGIDNIMVHQARDADILEPYQAYGADRELVDGLIDNLAPDNILTPYDFGVISPYFFKANFSDSFISSFTLDDLLDPQIGSQLIVENPLLSSPGLAFMLHSIGIYGDSASGVDGVVPGSDWISYWEDLSKDAFLSPSWGDAFGTLYSDDSRTMMISYSTSPAYDVCNYDDPSTDIALSTEDGKKWGWQQIEGMGVVKGADNTDLAQQFIDWFISETPQENVYLNQWVYPANKNIPMPECYSSITPLNQIDPINDLIPSSTIATHLNTWLDQWEQAVVLSS